MKIFEYMVSAKPIVAPRQENITEILRDDEAMFFRPQDAASLATALTGLVNDAEGARRMGQRACLAIVQRGYLWLSNASRVIELLEQSSSFTSDLERAPAVQRHHNNHTKVVH